MKIESHIRKNNLKIAIEFTQKIRDIKEVLSIILFGSVARGEDNLTSDTDIGVIFNKADKFELTQQINKQKHEKIQLTLVDIKDLYKETELVGALSGEGIILYGSPIKLIANKLELNSRVLISYSLNSLSQTEKVKLSRALYGSISRSVSKDKEYKTEVRGMVNEKGIDKINKGVLLVDRNKSTKIINLLKRFKADVKEIPFWTY